MATRIDIKRRPPDPGRGGSQKPPTPRPDRAHDQNERNSVEPSPIDTVRHAITEALEQGEPRPGRRKLVQRTGLKHHQVQKALAQLRAEEAEQDPSRDDQPRETVRTLRQTWPLILIGAAAAVAVWSGWVGLGKLAGFGMIEPLPGIANGWEINSSVVLPISVEAYAAYALRCWLTVGRFTPRTVRFAKWSAIISLVIGALAQVAYHLMSAAGLVRAPWPVTMLVACVPVAVLGLASALAKMVTADRRAPVSEGDAEVTA